MGERRETLFVSLRGERLLLGAIGQVQVFEPFDAVGAGDLLAELIGKRVLRFDRAENGLFSLVEQAELGDAVANAADLFFVEAARLVATVTGNEWHRVAVVQEGDSAGDFIVLDAKLARQAAEVDRNRGCHEKKRPGTGAGAGCSIIGFSMLDWVAGVEVAAATELPAKLC